MSKPLCVYIDVDETFVRSYGRKQIPVPNVICHIKKLSAQGAVMYCWSSDGAEYAKNSAIEFGMEHCFTGFLPKPELAIDDMQFNQWRNLFQVHPNECNSIAIATYKEKIIEQQPET